MRVFSLGRWLVFGLMWIVPIRLQADDWPQWRGPNRDNVSTETGLSKEWPEQGPPLLFQIEGLGQGIAPAAIVGDRGYAISEFDGYDYVVAFDANTGEQVWIAPIGVPSKATTNISHLMRWLSQRMPNVHDGKVYIVTEYGSLLCFSAADGTVLWSKDYRQEYGVRRMVFGYCDYPLIAGEQLICVPGGEQATVVALDRQTGIERWRCLLGVEANHRRQDPFQRSAYAATLRGQHGQIAYCIVITDSGVYFLDEFDGTLLAKYLGTQGRVANSHTPVFDNQDLVITNGYAGGMSRLSIDITENHIQLHEQFHHPFRFDAFQDIGLVVHGKFFGTRSGRNLIRIDPVRGAETQSRAMAGRFAHTYADGRLYVIDVNGNASLIDHDAEDLEPVSGFRIPDIKPASGVTMPVVANKKLYVRFDDQLFCFDISASPSDVPTETIIARHRRPELDPKLSAQGPPFPIFVPTPPDVVIRMLQEADLQPGELLVDLGSGDGRIVAEAANAFGAKAIGYEIEEDLVNQARRTVAGLGLSEMVKIEATDMYQADLSQVNVLAVYLYPAVMDQLKEQISKMPAGARVVSHQFQFSNVEPDKVIRLQSQDSGEHHSIYLYQLPLKVLK
jgi:outer membrane protein assembly factor BamB